MVQVIWGWMWLNDVTDDSVTTECFIPANNEFAHNKQTIQSSNYSSLYVSEKAVDGESSSCSSTTKEANNFWSVDLGIVTNIYHLFITNVYGSNSGELFS